MLIGEVQDYFPCLTLTLPGVDGPLEVEFIVDTAFYGEMALPGRLLRRLDAEPLMRRSLVLADGSARVSPAAELLLDWGGEPRLTEVLELDGSPLVGAILLDEFYLHSQMTDGGEVLIEPL